MEHRTCALDGCSIGLVKSPGRGRWPKWCPQHRPGLRVSPDRLKESRRRAASLAAQARWASSRASSCLHCAGPLGAPAETGPVSSYCSARCRRAASYARRKAQGSIRRAPLPPDRQFLCSKCNEEFSARRGRKFCSPQCERRWYDEDNPLRCLEAGCARGVRANSLCSMHWRRKARAEGRELSDPWSERRKANWKKRDAIKRGAASSEAFSYREIYERDEWTCGICAGPVDRSLEWPDPMSVSLDHVIPLSKGGAHAPANAQCAHLVCNVRKGALLPV